MIMWFIYVASFQTNKERMYIANKLERLRSVRGCIRHRAGLWLRNPRTADSVWRGVNASAFGEVFGAGRYDAVFSGRHVHARQTTESGARRRRCWRRERDLL